MPPRKVLIIEDDVDCAKLLSVIMKQSEHEVKAVSSGVDVLEIVRSFAPDLILLDVMLPGKSGYDVCREIRESKDVRDTPIFMVSAKATSMDVEKGIHVGANDYIVKPFDPNQLAERINRFFVLGIA